MRVTIVRDDNQVYVDGEAKTVDCSTLPADVHAIQWDGTKSFGDIEYASVQCASCGGVSRKPNLSFTDFTPYEAYVTAWNAAK